MYSRIIKCLPNKSFFQSGPEGTGKPCWLKTTFPERSMINLLDSQILAVGGTSRGVVTSEEHSLFNSGFLPKNSQSVKILNGWEFQSVRVLSGSSVNFRKKLQLPAIENDLH